MGHETPAERGRRTLAIDRTPSWLGRLGLFAKAHPVLVLCGASVGAFMIAMALLTAAPLAERGCANPGFKPITSSIR